MRNQIVAHIFATKYLHAQYMEVRRDVFQAIADPTRRAIIVLLTTGALTPNGLAQHFDTSRQAVSKHLKILTECELLKQKQQGREIYYHLNVDKMKEIDHWIDQFRNLWQLKFNRLDQLLTTFSPENQSP